MTNRIGLIGIGLLGSAIADRLIHAGFSVVGFDSRPCQLETFRSTGGLPATSAEEVSKDCATILLSLPTSDVVASVISQMHEHLTIGTTIIDTTTGDPVVAQQIASQLESRECHYLDATVVGSSQQALQGQTIVLAGGRGQIVTRCKHIFCTFASAIFHVGPNGNGARMKLVVNLVLGLNRAVLAEGLSFARSMNLPMDQTLEILRASAAYSTVMDNKGVKMIKGDFQTQARVTQHLKDVKLILQQGNRSDAYLPLSEVHRLLLEKVVEQGFGDADNSAIVTAFPHTSNIGKSEHETS